MNSKDKEGTSNFLITSRWDGSDKRLGFCENFQNLGLDIRYLPRRECYFQQNNCFHLNLEYNRIFWKLGWIGLPANVWENKILF